MVDSLIPNDIPKGRWTRIAPLAFIMYTISYMDRNNISFGFAGIQKDLGVSATFAGLAAGIFFWGYMLLQVPGGIWAQKFGPRKLISMGMVIWGILAAWTGYAHNISILLLVRFLLGTVEGIVFPSAMVLLSNWFPKKELARANAYFMMGAPISSIIAGPISGMILDSFGWREMFLFEAIPAIIWAVVWWFFIADTPSEAKWLTQKERDYIVKTQEEEGKSIVNQPKNFWEAVKTPNVLLLAISSFLGIMGLYGFTLWLPTIVKTITVGSSNTVVGWITALPWISAGFGLIICSYFSDRTGNHKLVYTLNCISAAIFLIAIAFTGKGHPVLSIIFLILLNFSYGKNAAFWSVPPTILKGSVLGSSVGFINAVGNLGGFFGPYLFGFLLTLTKSTQWGMIIFSVILFLSAVIINLVRTPEKSSFKHNQSLSATGVD